MLDIETLKHFMLIMNTKSFKTAAEQAAVSQSRMTRSIAHLEASLGLKLFNRTTRTVEPTDSARALTGRVSDLLRNAQALRDEARLIAAGDVGELRVAVIALATESLIADTLTQLADTHPNLEVEVIVGSADVYKDLVTGQCDVVLGDEANFTESIHAAQLRMMPLRRDSIVLVHRQDHPLQDDFEALIAQPLAIPSRYYDENQLFNRFKQRGGPAKPRYRLNSLSSCLALTERSDVITLAPASLEVTAHPGLTFRVDDPNDLAIDINLVMVTLASQLPTPGIKTLHGALVAGRTNA
ncbi:MAG: LysR family transcriptional regulator [Pseudomonadota bacterium]